MIAEYAPGSPTSLKEPPKAGSILWAYSQDAEWKSSQTSSVPGIVLTTISGS